ncbi:MAG: hypothetical protein ACRDZ9_05790 [Acidimicrobiales bacterium]
MDPPEDTPYVRGPRQGPQVLTGVASHPADPSHVIGGEGIEEVTFELEPLGPAPCTPIFDASQTSPGGEGEVPFSVEVTFPCNRSYLVTAVVEPKKGLAFDQPGRIELRFGVAIPPAPVSGLATTYTAGPGEGSPRIDLSWKANLEPDLKEYRVERAGPGGQFTEMGRTQEAKLRDTGIEVGKEYRYRVLAVRAGPDAQVTEVVSDPSPVVVVGTPDPTVPTTTATTVRGKGAVTRSSGRQSVSGSRRSVVGRQSVGPEGEATDPTSDLPFDPNAPRPEIGGSSVVAEIDEGRGPWDLLARVAGGVALVVGALYLRFLAKRASEAPTDTPTDTPADTAADHYAPF